MSGCWTRLHARVLLGLGLRAFLLSACLLLGACQHGSAKTEPSITPATPTLPPEPAQPLRVQEVNQAPPAPYHSKLDSKLAGTEAPGQGNDIAVLPQAQPPLFVLDRATPSRVQPASYTPKRSGLAAALENYLDRRNDEAVAALRRYPAEDQEFALATLPILANIDQGETWSVIAPNQRLAILESLRGLQRRLARSAPLVLQKVMFLDYVQSPYFGEVKPRSESAFRPEDWLCLYFELVNLTDSLGENSLYSAKINTAITLRSQNGDIVFADTCVFQKKESISPRTDFCFTASLTLPTVPPGAYQLCLAITDLETGRQAKSFLPLQILERPSRKKKN
jgi:hypothetical protein